GVCSSGLTGSTESVLELAYRLAVSEQPMIRRIRESLVVLINPVSNPDGRDKQVEWFYRFLKGKTDLATLPRQAPPYWSKYAFVDINRDAHQQVHETTRAVFHMFREWHPQVIHDLHESIALLVTWNGTGPINEHVDPLTYAERLELSFHEVQTLTALGMPGVWTWNFGDDFAQRSMRLLENSYLKAVHSYRRGLEQSPYAFLIPDRQGDPARVAQLVARLLAQGIEVHRAATDLTLKEGSFAAGTYVVRLDQ